TGVAVELELISLDLAGISTTETLKTASGWMPIGQWLEQSLAPAGMAVQIIDGRVLIHATPQRNAQASGEALRLDDFGQAAGEVTQWIRPVVGPMQPEDRAAEDAPDEEQADGPADEEPDADAEQPPGEQSWVALTDDQRLDVPL